jgi:hypothetical protein
MTLRKIVGEKERWANYINLVSLKQLIVLQKTDQG